MRKNYMVGEGSRWKISMHIFLLKKILDRCSQLRMYHHNHSEITYIAPFKLLWFGRKCHDVISTFIRISERMLYPNRCCAWRPWRPVKLRVCANRGSSPDIWQSDLISCLPFFFCLISLTFCGLWHYMHVGNSKTLSRYCGMLIIYLSLPSS